MEEMLPNTKFTSTYKSFVVANIQLTCEFERFMALSNAEVTYFITQVGLSAASFGVTTEDVTAVGTALASLFGVRCAPETTVIPAQGPQLQSICIASDCPLAVNNTCSAYEAVVEPSPANGTMPTSTSGSGGSGGGSSTSTPIQVPSNSAMKNSAGFAAVVGVVAALAL